MAQNDPARTDSADATGPTVAKTPDKPSERADRGARVFVPKSEFEIEFGDGRNRVMSWPPTAEIYRGAWKRANLVGDEMVEIISQFPDIPGMRLRLDPQRRKSVVYDVLYLPEHKEACARLQRLIKLHFGVDQGPAKPVERDRLDDDDIKTWYYWARRKVDAGQATIVRGELPDIDDVERMAGRVRIETFNSSARACKWKEDFDRYIDAILSAGRPVGV